MDTLLTNSNEHKLTALAKANFSSNIYPAELRIIYDSVREGPAKAHPNEPPTARHVRGDFLSWLTTDATATSYFDKDGLQVVSAIIDGDVDLDSANIQHDIRFDDCIFNASIHSSHSVLRNVLISNSTVNGAVSFEDATVRGDVVLKPNFKALGYVSTFSAQIFGGVYMQEAQLLFAGNDQRPCALSMDEADIKGDVFLTDFSCEGPVSILFAKMRMFMAVGATFKSTFKMTGTTIGQLSLQGTKFTLQRTLASSLSVPDSPAVVLDRIIVGGSLYLSTANLQCQPNSLSMQNATIAGGVYLTENLNASGKIVLSGVKITQALYVLLSKLLELDASDAEIGSLIVIKSEIKGFQCTGSKIGDFEWAGMVNAHNASLDLSRTRVKRFRDDQNSWPSTGGLQIIGLVYEDIELEVPIDRSIKRAPSKDRGKPDNRIAWLHLQSKGDLVASQPWTQLAQYVRNSGNPVGAQKVLYDMKRNQAWNEGLFTGSKSLVPDLLDENPWRVTYFIGAFWGVGSLIFWRARRINEKSMAPKEKSAYDEFSEKNTLPPHVPPFNSVVYSLENVLPVVKFGQDDAWGPNPAFRPAPREGWKRWLPRCSYNWLAFARLILIILGWALAIILAGVIGGLFKS